MPTTRHRNPIIIGSAVLLLLAFFTNPDQSAHLQAIKQTAALRQSEKMADALLFAVHYNNYLIFSTTNFGNETLTYGYFGQVQTTTGIEIFKPNSN